MSIFEEESSSTLSTSTPKCDMKIQLVSKSKSEKLLEKYFDAFECDFEYEQSGIWSPLVRRTAYVGSPGHLYTEQEMVATIRGVLEARNGGCTTRGYGCFHVWGCIASLFISFQKRVKRRKEITFDI